ncbi:MAG TPA: DUF2461 domain-containing protein [Ignavibacteriaceae bacterium]|nr:DUF2461 domain-containing protein [Ignavibacteriaceae bacterium]
MGTILSFPYNTQNFLKKLAKNNSKEWFEKNREAFNNDFLQPAVQFVVDMGEKLQTIAPNIMAVPKIDKSIFRLHRDIRFSRDKSPFKTNLGIFLWEGKEKKQSPGFYFHIEPKLFFLGSGTYMLENEKLKVYRNAVYNLELGKELDDAVKKVLKNKKYQLGGKYFKRVPKGFDPEYPYAEYLLHNGLYVYYESTDFDELSEGKNPVDFSFKIFRDFLPVHQWIVKSIK